MVKSQQIQEVLLTSVFLIALCFIPNSQLSASEKLDFSFRYSSNNRLTIDQTLTLHISFKWNGSENDYRFAVPSISAQNLELLRIGQSSKNEKTVFTKEFEYEFKALKIGDASIQDFQLPYTHAQETANQSIAIPGTHLKIIPQRKFRALWFIWLIILSILFLMVILIKKQQKLRNVVVNNSISVQTIEEKILKQLNEIDAHAPIQQKLNTAAMLLRTYREAKWSSANIASGLQEDRELNSLTTALKEARFSGSHIAENDCLNILNRVTAFIKKYQVAEPS